jgi:hypothetical protein
VLSVGMSINAVNSGAEVGCVLAERRHDVQVKPIMSPKLPRGCSLDRGSVAA